MINGPVYNLEAGLWRLPNVAANPPDRLFVCNLAHGKRMDSNANISTLFLGVGIAGQDLLTPRRTDVVGYGVDPGGAAWLDLVEVPYQSGRFYMV